MWSANGLSRTAKKKRGLVEDFLKKKMKSFRMLAQYVASEYTWAFQKIYKERTPRFFFKKKFSKSEKYSHQFATTDNWRHVKE
jgi:hypothetical protein